MLGTTPAPSPTPSPRAQGRYWGASPRGLCQLPCLVRIQGSTASNRSLCQPAPGTRGDTPAPTLVPKGALGVSCGGGLRGDEAKAEVGVRRRPRLQASCGAGNQGFITKLGIRRRVQHPPPPWVTHTHMRLTHTHTHPCVSHTHIHPCISHTHPHSKHNKSNRHPQPPPAVLLSPH